MRDGDQCRGVDFALQQPAKFLRPLLQQAAGLQTQGARSWGRGLLGGRRRGHRDGGLTDGWRLLRAFFCSVLQHVAVVDSHAGACSMGRLTGCHLPQLRGQEGVCV